MPDQVPLPVANLQVHGFEPLTPIEFGEDAGRRLVGAPLGSVTLFRDARSGLPGLLLIFRGIASLVSDQGLIVSAKPLLEHPFVELNYLLVAGASLDMLKYQSEPEADQPPQPDHEWAGRTDTAGQLQAIILHLSAVAAALTSGEPLALEHRQELAALLEPVISTFKGGLTAELARQAAQQPPATPEAAQ